jgi:hypothetical protein
VARPARSALHLIAAALVATAVGLVLPAGPAGAATCSSARGVSVVVDFHELGGVQTACVAGGGGKSGTSLLTSAGFALSYVQRQPGFICQINGLPTNDPCVNTPPADAYWGLWWSDGRSGKWTYATTAAGGLTVPEGGYVAFSWNGSAGRSAPGLSPAAHAVAPTKTPTPKPTSKPTSKPTTKASTKASSKASSKPGASTSQSSPPDPSQSGTTSSAPTSASPTKQQSGAAGQPTKPPGGVDGDMLPESAPPSTDATPAAGEPADPSDGGLPTWVGPIVVVVLFAAGGAVAVVRRRRNPTP